MTEQKRPEQDTLLERIKQELAPENDHPTRRSNNPYSLLAEAAALIEQQGAELAQLAQAEGREKALREDALKAIDAAIQCESDVLDVYQRRVSLTTLDLAVADMKQDSLPKLKAARAALAQAGGED